MSDYKALFEEASDILYGFKRVRTYDDKITEYYYKNAEATNADELFIPNTSINSLASFASALQKFKILYVREGSPTPGFEPMPGITTLEEYFSWLSILGNEELGGHRKYTVLPLDEDCFEINANTRAINVPASFKKNGIAVQGDDLAEIVYFKVDRYFDYKDLNTADIYIQWETPKDAEGKSLKAVSEVYVRDIESEPGKLIFGWAISEAITGVSGNLKFSVRFFEWEDADEAKSGSNKKLVYSLSTLTAQVPIQASINLDIQTVENLYIDDCGDRLVQRLENSIIAGGYAAAEPIFVKDLDKPNADLIYDLIFNPDASEDEVQYGYELLAHAYATDTGSVSYIWKKQELNEDNEVTGEEITTSIVENRMVEIEDVANATSEKYPYTLYQMNGSDINGKPIYTVYRGTLPPSVEDVEKGLRLFEKHSAFTADSAGVYWVIAENRITNSSTPAFSKKAMFPRPDYIKITEQPIAKGILRDIDNDDPDLGPVCPLSVKVEDQDSTVQVKTYQWYRDSNYALNFGNEDPAYLLIEGETEATYNATEPGHYRVEITNTRNNAEKVVYSEKSRVTMPAQTPIIEPTGVNAKIFQVSSLSADNCPAVTMNTSVESDGYSVIWYLFENETPVQITEKIDLAPGVVKASFNPFDYEDKIKEVSADHDIDGAYYAIVINNVNDDSASTAAPDYTDMFKITY